MSVVKLYNNTLNPDLWDIDGNLFSDVSKRLLEIGMDFYNKLDVKMPLEDIWLVGSSANYNWDKDSDIDLHIVVNSDALGLESDKSDAFFRNMMGLWNKSHHIKIKNHAVEVYLQDTTHIMATAGIYSIYKAYWIKKPVKEHVEVDKDSIIKKYNNYVYKIEKLIKNPSVEVIENIIEALWRYRSMGLGSKSGEMSTENIVYKILRRRGYVEKLKDVKNKLYDKEMTLNEMPTMTKVGKEVHADSTPLKNLKLEDVRENIVVFRVPEGDNGFFQPGYTLVYFMDSKESTELMKQGKIPYLMCPYGTIQSGGSPITDIWKKKFQKPGTEHILGHLQGHTDDSVIFVNMLTVRPGYRRNSISTKMIEILKQERPNAEFKHSSPTDDGSKFLKNFLKEILINENNSVNVEDEYSQRYDTLYKQTYDDFHSGKSKQQWKLIPSELLKNVWFTFAKYHRVDEEKVKKIWEILQDCILKIEINSNLIYGDAPKFFNFDSLDDVPIEQLNKLFSFLQYDTNAIKQLMLLYWRAAKSKTSEELFMCIDRILNFTHGRGPMAGWFVEGGTKTLDVVRDYQVKGIHLKEEIKDKN